MNITYIFGAGASFGTIPIVSQFPSALRTFSEKLERYNRDVIEKRMKLSEMEQIKWMIDSYRLLALKAEEFQTIDTYGEYLYGVKHEDKHPMDFMKFKNLLSYYFTVLQYEQTVHNRYNYLFTKIGKHINSINESSKVNINIITWNYDFQVELSLNNLYFKNSHPSNIIDTLNVRPFNRESFGTSNSKIIHLNGIASLYTNDEGFSRQTNSLLLRTELKDTNEIFEIIPYTILSKKGNTVNYCFSFNFEKKDKYQPDLISEACNILEKTDQTIIIGYSFPIDNKTVDNQLIEKLNNSNSKIIIQNPILNEKIKSKFTSENIEYLTDVHSFYIPDDLIGNT